MQQQPGEVGGILPRVERVGVPTKEEQQPMVVDREVERHCHPWPPWGE